MKTYRHIILIPILLLALLLGACGSTPTSDPVSVIQAYHAAVNNPEVEAALALFADDGELHDPLGDFKGQAAILTRLKVMADRRLTFEAGNFQVNGEVVMWEQKVFRFGELIAEGPSLAVVRAGKIQSIGQAPASPTALPVIQLPAESADPWGVVVVPKGETIKLAVAADPNTYGDDVRLGAQLGAADFGDDIQGFAIEIINFEDHSSPTWTKAAEAIVANPHIVGVIGPMFSNSLIRESEILDAAHVVMISASATAPEVTTRGLMTLNRTALSNRYTVKAAAEFARTQLGFETAAVIYDEGAYGRSLGEGFKEAFEQGGGTITFFEMRPAGQNGFGDMLARITPNKPQLIFYGGAYFQAAGLVAEKNTFGLQDTALMSGDGIFFPDFIAIGGADAEGSYAAIASAPASAHWDEFLQKYESAGGRRDAVAFGPNAYDAVGILAQAIKSVATVNSAGHLEIGRQALANAVRATRAYAGLTGSITFDANGDRTLGEVVIYQVQGEKWVQVFPKK